jgi:hypothetical protein
VRAPLAARDARSRRSRVARGIAARATDSTSSRRAPACDRWASPVLELWTSSCAPSDPDSSKTSTSKIRSYVRELVTWRHSLPPALPAHERWLCPGALPDRPVGRWRSAADCAVVASTAPRIATPRCSSFPLCTPRAGRPARRARQHGHHIGRAGWRPPGRLPDAPPRRMMVTARSLAVSLEEARDPQGASAVGQDRAGARSRRAPAPPSSWVCPSTPCGRPAEPAAARRRDQPAAPAHGRHGRFRPLRSRARLARRCEAPGLYGGRRGIDTRGGRATRAALEAGAIIGLAMARSPRAECE